MGHLYIIQYLDDQSHGDNVMSNMLLFTLVILAI